MDKQETAERIKVMQAFVDGKTIQTRNTGVTIHLDGRHTTEPWYDEPEPSWTQHREYRIKPEPREWRMELDAAGNLFHFGGSKGRVPVTVREILSDD